MSHVILMSGKSFNMYSQNYKIWSFELYDKLRTKIAHTMQKFSQQDYCNEDYHFQKPFCSKFKIMLLSEHGILFTGWYIILC